MSGRSCDDGTTEAGAAGRGADEFDKHAGPDGFAAGAAPTRPRGAAGIAALLEP